MLTYFLYPASGGQDKQETDHKPIGGESLVDLKLQGSIVCNRLIAPIL